MNINDYQQQARQSSSTLGGQGDER